MPNQLMPVRRRDPDRSACVLDEHRGDRGDRTGVIDDQQIPAIDECDDEAEGFAQIHVAAAGGRPARTEFGIAQRADERDDAADRPCEQLFRG